MRGSKREYLRFVLCPKRAGANFDQDDDRNTTVVADNHFPQGDKYVWRLQAAADHAGTRLTATDDTGTPISVYDRVAKQDFIPSFTLAMIFGLAVGYELTADYCSATGAVIENIINKELIQLDLGDA